MRVLVVKTSSMGDVIHALPAVTEAKQQRPSIIFDWVVEEGFSEIPRWHPAVEQVIPVAIRRWRKSFFQTVGSPEWREFKTQLRRQHYDMIIDCQGLVKSAWVSRLARGPVAGYDRQSAREGLASWFYQQRCHVAKQQHAVERIRELFSKVLGYPKPAGRGQYGIDRSILHGSSLESANIVFLHATTRDDKLYPEAYWRALAEKLSADGYRIRLPWGQDFERERAGRIAEDIPGVEVLPRLNLQGVAGVLAQATAVVAVDTGLGHLSAALDVPTLSLYGPTNPALVGAYGNNQVHLCANSEGAGNKAEDASLAALDPDTVYSTLQERVLARSDSMVMQKLS